MSVLIKDMNMPRNCAECPFLYDGNACYAVNEPDSLFLPLVCNGRTGEYLVNEFPFHEKRVDWCPLVEVPTPHGDLIDGDKLYSEVAKAHAYEHLSVKRIIAMVRNSSTVIEAEE